ncbi:MAG: DUF1593 domain-containing protein [Chitinispirillaceae bacterium]|nr:DUF1593 domain-containing protein [Chitinispirillaceae bacterium]
MKKILLSLAMIASVFFAISISAHAAQLKPRLVVLTDIGPNDIEPDDRESMTRLLASADLFEIELLCGGEGWNTGNYPPGWLDSIKSTINAYEKDVTNLMKRSSQTGYSADESHQEIGYWPSPAYLRSRTMLGSPRMGYSVLGDGNNSAGSNYIIQLADESDTRPIHVSVWGGANTLAQAIWRVQKERTAAQLKTFLNKISVYTITDQDMPWNTTNWSSSSHYWMRQQFSHDLLFMWDECAWLFQNSNGVTHWTDYQTNIQGHGNLGAQYPIYKWGVEGDTPSFIYLMLLGLSDFRVPTQCSWGGYFQFMTTKDGVTSAYTNHQGTSAYDTCLKYVTYFYQADFNNFAARMDWAQSGTGNRNPVAIVNNDSTYNILTLKPQQGMSVTLDASSSYDPNGNNMTFRWWIMAAAGTYTQSVAILNATSNRGTVNVPANSAGKSFHVILEVTDNGTPALTSYRRIIFEPVVQTSILMTPVQKHLQFTKELNTTCYDLTGRLLKTFGCSNPTCGVVLRRDKSNRVEPLLKLH